MHCVAHGLRLTDQRRAVLQLLCVSDKPLSAYELLDRMRGVVKNPTPPTVYRALDFLLEQGLVHKLESLQWNYWGPVRNVRRSEPNRPPPVEIK